MAYSRVDVPQRNTQVWGNTHLVELTPAVEEWLEQNIGYRRYSVEVSEMTPDRWWSILRDYHSVFHKVPTPIFFGSAKDAVLFKMTWL